MLEVLIGICLWVVVLVELDSRLRVRRNILTLIMFTILCARFAAMGSPGVGEAVLMISWRVTTSSKIAITIIKNLAIW